MDTEWGGGVVLRGINRGEGAPSCDSHAAAASVRVHVIALLMHASLSLNPPVSLWNWKDLMLLSCWINFLASFWIDFAPHSQEEGSIKEKF